MIYKKIIRPLFFRIDPERIHNQAIFFLKFASENDLLSNISKKLFFVSNKKLQMKIGNLELENPVGLAAGFDKNIDAPFAYEMLGFGFVEFGSITFRAQPGNEKPRLWRLPKDKSLIVYYGLSNCGAAKARKKLMNIKKKMKIPYGISIAPTTGLDLSNMENDYICSFYELSKHANYVTFNVSCPNVSNCDIFSQISFVESLISKIRAITKKKGIKKDIFIKIGPELGEENIDKIIDLCLLHRLTGIIATNLVKSRENILCKSDSKELQNPGGISGKILEERSNDVIKYIYKKTKGELKIIGVGGVFSACDAYKKIKLGANAIQMITGFIYGGPLTIRLINKELLKLLKQDGYSCLENAVGADVHLGKNNR